MGKSRKRKVDSLSTGSQEQSSPLKLSKSARKRQRVTLDQLGWSAVDVPDNLEDYEGLYGLEEVDDVEVVKEDGRVTFRADHNDSNEQPEPQTQPVLNEARDEDEWEGFSDSDLELPNKVEDGVYTSRDESVSEDKLQRRMVEPRDSLVDVGFSALSEELLEDGVDTSEWQSLSLSPEVQSALSAMKFHRPTPIQSATIPQIIDGHDVIGKASTGSGKTLAYGIPIMESFLKATKKSKEQVLALILSPTRELAHQISKHLTTLCTTGGFRGPKIASITGGLSIQKQERVLATANVVVGTPGRLWEVMSTSKATLARLKEVKFLVLDEADRLLSEGHFKEVEEILTTLDKVDDGESENGESLPPRQTLVFSATFHKDLQRKLGAKARSGGDLMDKRDSMTYLIQKLNFREERPAFVDVDPISQLAHGIKEGLVECAAAEKDLYLYAMMLLHPRTRTLVFTNSISAVRRLTPFLQNLNLPAQALHSGMIQKARLRAVEKFSKAESSILISTDVAARGLDIPGIQLIIHYHLPRAADMYVHRSGRTARAENKGGSVILCSPEEVTGVRRLIARVHAQGGNESSNGIPTLNVDRRVVARLKPRATLAKKIADVGVAKHKGRSDDKFFRDAAEELGVEYDSEELDKMGGGKRGRGNVRKQKERENREVGKDQISAWNAELKNLLSQRVNLGISEKYIAQGVVDVDALLRGEKGDFLGAATLLDLENL